MKEMSKMRMSHLGGGIIQFDNAMAILEKNINDFISDVEKNAHHQGFSKDEQKNDGGYSFTEKEFSEAPERYVNLANSLKSENGKAFLKDIEESVYFCLVEYCKLFPVATSEISWGTDGYVIKYSHGQSIGPHSDCALPYADDGITPINSFPLYNTLTCSLVLNGGYEGGAISFKPWGISVNPRPGSMLIYPSSFIGCHEVAPVTSGSRYAYLKWFGHGKPNNMNPTHLGSLKSDVSKNPWEQQFVKVGEIQE